MRCCQAQWEYFENIFDARPYHLGSKNYSTHQLHSFPFRLHHFHYATFGNCHQYTIWVRVQHVINHLCYLDPQFEIITYCCPQTVHADITETLLQSWNRLEGIIVLNTLSIYTVSTIRKIFTSMSHCWDLWLFQRFIGPLFQTKLYLLSTALLSGFQSFDFHWERQYLVNFISQAGIINATVCKTEAIFTVVVDSKLS